MRLTNLWFDFGIFFVALLMAISAYFEIARMWSDKEPVTFSAVLAAGTFLMLAVVCLGLSIRLGLFQKKVRAGRRRIEAMLNDDGIHEEG